MRLLATVEAGQDTRINDGKRGADGRLVYGDAVEGPAPDR